MLEKAIEDLRDWVAEGAIELNPASVKDFTEFASKIESFKSAELGADEDGCLIADWRIEGEWLHVVFLGDERVRYVYHKMVPATGLKWVVPAQESSMRWLETFIAAVKVKGLHGKVAERLIAALC